MSVLCLPKIVMGKNHKCENEALESQWLTEKGNKFLSYFEAVKMKIEINLHDQGC